MKKATLISTLLIVLVLALGMTSIASADSGDPVPGTDNCGWIDNLFQQNGCSFGQTNRSQVDQDDILHDYLVKLFAEETGLSTSEIETRLDGGESMSEIAYSVGITQADFFSFMQDARIKAIELAVADGVLTSEQAEWMTSRGGMMFGDFDDSRVGLGGFMQSGRMGRFGGNQICPVEP